MFETKTEDVRVNLCHYKCFFCKYNKNEKYFLGIEYEVISSSNITLYFILLFSHNEVQLLISNLFTNNYIKNDFQHSVCICGNSFE